MWGPEAPSCGSEGVTGHSLGMDVAPSICELAGVSTRKLLWFFSPVLGSGAAIRPSMVQECTSRFSLPWEVAAQMPL